VSGVARAAGKPDDKTFKSGRLSPRLGGERPWPLSLPQVIIAVNIIDLLGGCAHLVENFQTLWACLLAQTDSRAASLRDGGLPEHPDRRPPQEYALPECWPGARSRVAPIAWTSCLLCDGRLEPKTVPWPTARWIRRCAAGLPHEARTPCSCRAIALAAVLGG